MLYKDASILVKHQGQILAPISFRRGIRQGCPLSGMLYNIALEPLLVNLRRALREYAVTLPFSNIRALILAYADDLTIFLTRGEAFPIAQAIFKQYERYSGSRINLNKSQGLWCGSWRNRADSPLGIQWTDTNLKYLGVYIGRDAKSFNRRMALEKVSKAIHAWQNRLFHLSLKGRTVVINYLITSSIVHVIKSEPPGEDLLRLLQTKVVNAFWCGRHWIAEGILCAPVAKGGLGLTNLIVKVKCLQMRMFQRIFCNRDTLISKLWRSLFNQHYSGCNDNFYLLATQPPYPSDWTWDLIYIIQTWNRIRPEFHLNWSSMGYAHFSSIPLRLNPELTDPLFSSNRGITADLSPLVVLGDIVDSDGRNLVQPITPILRELTATAHSKYDTLNKDRTIAHLTDAFICNKVASTSFSGFTTRKFRDIFTRLYPPNFTGIRKWRSTFQITHRLEDEISCKILYSYPSNQKDSDIAFQLLHHGLKHPNQLSHIDNRVPRICKVCLGEGTLAHRFFYCPSLHDIMSLVKRVCHLICPQFVVTETSFLFGPKTHSQRNCMISFYLTLAKSTIHLYHNKVDTNGTNMNLEEHACRIRQHYTARIKKRIRLDFCTMGTTQSDSIWRPIAFIRNGEISFNV